MGPRCTVPGSPHPGRAVRTVILHFAALLASCSRLDGPPAAGGPGSGAAAASGPAWFEDITAAAGLDFVHDAGKPGQYFMPEVVGSGAAFLDYDRDGRLDLYLLQNGSANGTAGESSSKNRLYHQEPDGKLRDVSAGSGLDVAGRGMGV